MDKNLLNFLSITRVNNSSFIDNKGIIKKLLKPNEKGAIELNVPIELSHKFRIGSITKQFTAVSVLLLQERGQLNLNDSIQKHLPNFPTKKYKITILLFTW